MSEPYMAESVATIVLSTAIATSSVFVAVHGYPVWVSLLLALLAALSLTWALSTWRRQQRARGES